MPYRPTNEYPPEWDEEDEPKELDDYGDFEDE